MLYDDVPHVTPGDDAPAAVFAGAIVSTVANIRHGRAYSGVTGETRFVAHSDDAGVIVTVRGVTLSMFPIARNPRNGGWMTGDSGRATGRGASCMIADAGDVRHAATVIVNRARRLAAMIGGAA